MPVLRECPGIECWRALLADTVTAEERERFEQHLESCADCQARLHQADEGGDAVRRLGRRVGDPTLVPSDPTLVHVLERLHEAKSTDRVAPIEELDLYFLRPSDRQDLLGTLGSYEVQEVIGQGGMGIVLKAFEPALHRLVAIKVLAAAVAGSATARRRFTREAQAAAAVCHDHIVTVHGVHEADSLPYLVMQYVAGESLQARIDRVGPLEIVEIVRIGLQTASGLAAAHAQGLIHRDIKPANLLLENGLARVKITDFGLARMVDDVGLTQNGVVAGTPEYMAPEQARAEAVDHRADLFSLGSVLYAMCTGHSPFRGTSALAVLRQVSEEEPVRIRSLNPDVPAWLEALIGRLMTKDPAGRFQSAAEVAELLEGYLAHLRQPLSVPAPELPRSEIDEDDDSQSPRARTALVAWIPFSFALASLVILAALGVGFFFVANEKDNRPKLLQEYSQSFKGEPKNQEGMKFVGPEADECVKYEPEGLRITLPSGWEGVHSNTGLRIALPVKGDFEMTVTFEILAEPTPEEAGNQQTRFTMGVGLNKEGVNAATLSRRVGMRRGTEFMGWMTLLNETTGKQQERAKAFPTKAKSGRLRLSRTGPVIAYYASEGLDGDFILLHEFTFGSEDLKDVHVVGSTGNARCSLDVRVTDLRLRAESLPSLSGNTPGKPIGKGWLTAAGVVGLVLTLSLSVWTLLYLRHRRRVGMKRESLRAENEPMKPEATWPTVSFPCSECGKNLKAKTNLGGKKVKCPQCGKPVMVPETTSRASVASVQKGIT